MCRNIQEIIQLKKLLKCLITLDTVMLNNTNRPISIDIIVKIFAYVFVFSSFMSPNSIISTSQKVVESTHCFFHLYHLNYQNNHCTY